MSKKTYYEWLSRKAAGEGGFTVLTTLVNKESVVGKGDAQAALARTEEVLKGRVEKDGRPYICACEHTQSYFERSGFNKAYDHANESEQILGGWFNEKDGKIYFDSVRNYFSLDAAQEAADRFKQFAFCQFEFKKGKLQAPIIWQKKGKVWSPVEAGK